MDGSLGPFSSGNESHLDLEPLKEYEAGEAEQFDSYVKRLTGGETTPYPSPERFRRLTQPVAKSASGGSLWSQIPLYGSLVIPLLPVPEADFPKVHQFEIADLPRLIDLCKETGRVQFALAARPTQFAGLLYLDPVLTELRPPVIRTTPNAAVFDEASLKKANLLFDTMASVSLWPLVRTSLLKAGLDYRYADQTYETLRSSYAMLKLLGYGKAVAEIEDCIVTDSPRAYRILYFYSQFVQGPIFDPLKGVVCFSRDYIKEMKKIPGSTEARTEMFPCEIGVLLLNSVVPAPDNLEACLAVTDRYQSAGAAELVSDLSSAIAESKLEEINSASEGLGDALKSVWDGVRNKPVPGVTNGVTFEVAAGGDAAAGLLTGGPEGARTGLLSALGFQLTDKAAEAASENPKALSRSYTMSIYNFQKKHRLDR